MNPADEKIHYVPIFEKKVIGLDGLVGWLGCMVGMGVCVWWLCLVVGFGGMGSSPLQMPGVWPRTTNLFKST